MTDNLFWGLVILWLCASSGCDFLERRVCHAAGGAYVSGECLKVELIK